MRAEHGYAHTLRWWLVAAALALLSLSASARMTDKTAELIWSQTGSSATAGLGAGSTPLQFKPTATGGIEANGKKGLPWPGKNQAENMANWKMMASPKNMAKSLITPLGIASMAAVPIAKQLIDLACVRLAGGELRAGAVWDECVMTQTTPMHYWINEGIFPANTSREAYCRGYVNNMNNPLYNASAQTYDYIYMGYTNSGGSSFPDGGICTYETITKGVPYTHNVINRSMTQGTRVVNTQSGWQPTTTAAVEAKLEAKIKEWCQSDFNSGLTDGKCAQAAGEIASPNIGLLTDMEPSSLQPCQLGVNWSCPTLSGPAKVDQTSKTEQKTITRSNPDGTTSTSVTTIITTITNNYTYEGNKVTNREETKTTTTADGVTTEQVENKVEEKPTEAPSELCKANPDAAMCQKLDTPTGEVPKSTKEVVFQTEDMGWGSGSCPAPFTWNDTLGSHSINLATFCDKITTVVRPLVLLLASLAALAIAMPGIKD